MLDFISPYLSMILTISAVIGVLFPIFKWVFTVNSNIKKILTELTCTPGSSLTDKIIKMSEEYEARKKLLDYIYSTQKWILSVSDKMFFECDGIGEWTEVNDSLKDKLNLNENQLLASGWKNYIALEDRNIAISSWEKGIKNGKKMSIRCRFEVNNIKNEKSYVDMRIVAEKINTDLWVGLIQEFDPALIDRNKTNK